MKKNGFTILELLIALSISSVVILGMLQGYRNVSNMIERSRNLMVLNRKVCLFFNQFERDLTACFIPVLYEKNLRSLDKPRDKGDRDKKEKKDKDEFENKFYFVGEIAPDLEEKINGRRKELFKSLNFITTNALRIYSEKRVMFVRVMYELVKDKEKSTRDKAVYQLFRRETTDLDNFKFKEDDSILQQDKKSDIKTYLIADNIKNLFVEYIADKTEQEKNLLRQAQDDRGQAEKVSLFTWGETKDTENLVPEMVNVFVTFWDEKLEKENNFECLIPILSYPSQKPDEEKTKNENAKPGQQKANAPPVQGTPKLQRR